MPQKARVQSSIDSIYYAVLKGINDSITVRDDKDYEKLFRITENIKKFAGMKYMLLLY